MSDSQAPVPPMADPETPVRSKASSASDSPRSSTVSKPVPSIFSGNNIPSPARRRTDGTCPPDSINIHHLRKYSNASDSAATEPGPLSPDAIDRVFPMKSFVSVDPTPTPSQYRVRDSYFGTTLQEGPSTGAAAAGRRQPTILEGVDDPYNTQTSAGEDSTDESPRKVSEGSGPGQHSVRFSGQGYQIYSDTASIRSGKSGVSEGVPNNDNGPARPPSAGSAATGRDGKEEDPGGLLTARFKHVVTEGGHAVITGRDGETLQRCEDEPIHIPGAVQSFGMLIALREESEGRLSVRIVSENSKRLMGYSPRQLFALDSFTDLLSEEQAENLLDHIDFIKDEGADVEQNGPEVFTISIRNLQRRSQKFWCAIHTNAANPGLVICEFELEDDHTNPLAPVNEGTPDLPEDTLSSEPTEDELRESTENRSRPLRVLRSARKRKGEAATMEVFNIMSQVQEQLAEAPNLDAFLKVLVGVVKELTGFHRVMVYQFDASWNGRVVTELVDPRATKDLYKGLHFPASDIPKQARDLYKINRVRLLYDRDQETARLVCKTIEDLETPLDMTHSYLRAMSPIHIKYLANMAVRSSMSISINAFNELWGLISCHTYGQKGTRVSFPIRKMCRLVGDSASRNIERLSYASRLQARKLINTAPTQKNPSGYIIASSEDLLKLFDADFGVLSIHGETKILGRLEATQEALAMLEYLRMRSLASVVTSLDIREDFPDLRYPPGFKVLAGLLLVPLSASGADFIVFFRKGQLKEVKWAGNPYEKYIKEGTEGYLEPRKSFKTWSETVVGKCREWTEEEIETAAVLCLVYGKFIEVWRQKEAALENSQLTKLLLANSAHEVRTPLNAIINYLEIALEGSLDNETRENLAKSHSASKSLIYVINDLLDLTKTEAGTELVRGESMDLKATFNEAVDMFRSEAARKKIYYDIIEHSHIPEQVLGDQRRVRQAISNVIANAIEATTEGGVKVEMLVSARRDSQVDVEVIVEDTGTGMNSSKLDALFAELEQVQAETNAVIEETIAPNAKTLTGVKEERALGLGLAVVARVVKNMNGQLRLKSEAGKGSRFVIQFPFDLPKAESQGRLMPDSERTSLSEPSGLQSDAFKTQSEVTLIGRSPSRATSSSHSRDGSPRELSRRNSNNSLGSARSLNSFKSGRSGKSFSSVQSGKSDVDRLIEAMQEPHMVEGSPSHERPRLKSRTSHHRVSWENLPESSAAQRARSHDVVPTTKVPPYLRSGEASQPGEQLVTDSSQPMRAIRVPSPDGFAGRIEDFRPGSAPATPMVAEVPERPEEPVEKGREEVGPRVQAGAPLDAKQMSVLVAEDDPINSKIVQKRMQKAGHDVYLTVNGEECATAFGEEPGKFDVVLMDMQMPIVDGLSSTKMIRSFEKSHPTSILSDRASLNGRVPVIAVSATLEEKKRQNYMDAGFDGWILKPINFARLSELMHGIVDHEIRTSALYKPGGWEHGGWFQAAQPDVYSASTDPSEREPFADTEKIVEAKESEKERTEQMSTMREAT